MLRIIDYQASGKNYGSKSNRVVFIKSLKGNASAFPFFFLFSCSNNVAKVLLN